MSNGRRVHTGQPAGGHTLNLSVNNWGWHKFRTFSQKVPYKIRVTRTASSLSIVQGANSGSIWSCSWGGPLKNLTRVSFYLWTRTGSRRSDSPVNVRPTGSCSWKVQPKVYTPLGPTLCLVPFDCANERERRTFEQGATCPNSAKKFSTESGASNADTGEALKIPYLNDRAEWMIGNITNAITFRNSLLEDKSGHQRRI